VEYVNNKQEKWQFKFNKILHNVNQEVMYDECADDIVNSVLQGYNGTILAYGQTGAGKTFTMMGGTQSYKYRGIAPRAIGHIFRHIQANPQVAVSVKISYLEVYNEQYFDLLKDSNRLGDMAVMDDEHGNTMVKGLTKLTATSEEEALNLLFEGETNRAIAEHQMNKNSTRSHCVFTVHLDIRSRVESSEKVVHCKLNLVDLAGSERVKNTGSTGKTLSEANFINKSLTFLEQVVIALSTKSRDHIPYRQSKLTNVLRDSLGGNCKTRLIANIYGEKKHIHETVSTLKFATRMMRVANAAVVNERQDPALLLKKCERQIRQLKQELAMHDSLANRSNVQYDDFTPEQQKAAYDSVVDYVDGKSDEIKIVNIAQIKETFRQFKIFTQNLQSRVAVTANSSKGSAETKGAGAVESKEAAAPEAGYVGEIDSGAGGFHIGDADTGAGPAKVAPKSSYVPSSPKATQKDSKHEESETQPVMSEAEAFEEYKKKEGKEDNDLFEENKKEYQAKKVQLKTLSNEVNRLKGEIDKLTAELTDMRRATTAHGENKASNGPPVIDEGEYILIRKLKQKKRDYQESFHKRKMVKNEVSYLKSLVKQSKLKLCSTFLEWRKQANATSKPNAAGAPEINEPEILDDGEQFDALERQRVMDEDPDSIAFFNAKKTMTMSLKRKARRKKR